MDITDAMSTMLGIPESSEPTMELGYGQEFGTMVVTGTCTISSDCD